MTTLDVYWTQELTRAQALAARLATAATQGQAALQAAEADERLAADALRAAEQAVRDARARLALIPMPGDGDPELAAMQAALVARAEASAAAARGALRAQALRAQLAQVMDAQRAAADELREIRAEHLREAGDGSPQRRGDAAARRALVALLKGTGALADLKQRATDALAASETLAVQRVEGEFPANAGAPTKDFLTRVRHRRSLVVSAQQAADAVDGAAFAARSTALERARRAFQVALDDVRGLTEAAPVVAADAATLAALAALPAPTAVSFPIVTRWQHERLHAAGLKADREAALVLLRAVDTATATLIDARKDYELAVAAAQAAQPDLSPSEIDALGAVQPKRLALNTAESALQTKRDAFTALPVQPAPPAPPVPSAQQTAQDWFACVPDALWDALERLDSARARLATLASGAPAPALRADALDTAEAAYVSALEASRLAARQDAARGASERGAAETQRAQRATAMARARAAARSTGWL